MSKGQENPVGHDPKRWVAAPQSTLQGAPAVLGVYLGDDEDAQWIWTHTQNGSYVSGYRVIKRTPGAGMEQS
jgi:hypothetical protein